MSLELYKIKMYIQKCKYIKDETSEREKKAEVNCGEVDVTMQLEDLGVFAFWVHLKLLF